MNKYIVFHVGPEHRNKNKLTFENKYLKINEYLKLYKCTQYNL
jgi:hypothetical protein